MPVKRRAVLKPGIGKANRLLRPPSNQSCTPPCFPADQLKSSALGSSRMSYVALSRQPSIGREVVHLRIGSLYGILGPLEIMRPQAICAAISPCIHDRGIRARKHCSMPSWGRALVSKGRQHRGRSAQGMSPMIG
jgi:hypothetical protein